MARRQGYIGEFVKRYAEVPYLHVDLGYFFSQQREPGSTGLPEDVRVANRWALRAYQAMNVAAANISFRDLNQLEEMLASETYQNQQQQFPLLGRLISANVRPANRAYVAPRPYLIQVLSGGRIKRPLKIGLVGLTVDGFALEEAKHDRLSNARQRAAKSQPRSAPAFSIEDPLAVAQRMLPGVRAQADLLVVLAHMPMTMADRLAKQNPEIDVMMVANKIALPQPPRLIGKTLVTTSTNEGKVLGELRIYLNPQGRIARVVNRYVGLDEVVPDDPTLTKLRDQARVEVNAARMKMLGAKQQELKSKTPAIGSSTP